MYYHNLSIQKSKAVDIKKLKRLAGDFKVQDLIMFVCKSIKTFDFYAFIYTTIPHMLLFPRIKELIQRCFSMKNGWQMYQYLIIGRDKSNFVKNYSKSNNKYKQDEIIHMLDF